MTQSKRLPEGGRIDRKRALEFRFNDQAYMGYSGDTLASALLANDIKVVARSFKYHRPRGIVGHGAEEPNAILQLGRGARALPNQRATQVELYEGLEARSMNCWPRVDFDLLAVTGGLFGKFLPAGFYYKTFMWPQSLWMGYERYIRKMAGLGTAPELPDPDHYDKMHMHCEVLVVGGGPAGLAAALAAGKTGARVILADEQNEFGGSLLASAEKIDGKPATEWMSKTLHSLHGMDEVRLLPRSTVFGYYDHNFLGILERRSDHLPPGINTGSRQRLWRVRAQQVVLATGAIERPLVFGNNDRPGVMLASSVSTYIRRYAVRPGNKAVVFANNDSAYRTVLDLDAAGIEVTAIIDSRHETNGRLTGMVRERGHEIFARHAIVNVQGNQHIEGVQVMKLGAGDSEVIPRTVRGIACDLVAVSGGWNPAVHLHSQSGGRARWDDELACFVPGTSVQAERSVGAAAGRFLLGECLADGLRAGAEAAAAAGFGDGKPPAVPLTEDIEQQALQALWVVPAEVKLSRAPKRFLDLQNDTTAADIQLAAREGFRSIEHVKRYTALGFGTDQGKLGNINGMAILAKTLGKTIPQTGTTTFRPAYTPVTWGAMAGRDIGPFFDPVRKTAMHEWHVEHSALFENVGQWKRPWYYPKAGENIHAAVRRECLAVRNSVGIMDASTLGKIDIRGPDAAEFLNRMYTNGWLKLGAGRCRYGLMLGEDGMVMDDGVTTRLADDRFHMTTTTGGAARVMAWLERWLQTEWPDLKVYLTSVTDQWAVMAVAGPDSRKLVSKLCEDIDFSPDAFPFMSYRQGTVAGVAARVFRISFSGELAYEINVPANVGRYVWERAMEAGKEFDITPYGTETMHVLRAEKGYIIVGQDTDGSQTPIDLGMDWIVAKNKDFVGKRSLTREDCLREDRKQLVGLRTKDPAVVLPEGGQIIHQPHNKFSGGVVPMLGHVTSSYYSAALGYSIALAVVKGGSKRHGETVYVPLNNGVSVAAEITAPVFYDPEGGRLHG